MRRRTLFAGQIVLLLLVLTTLYYEGDRLTQLRPPPLSLRPLGGADVVDGGEVDSPAGQPVEGSRPQETAAPSAAADKNTFLAGEDAAESIDRSSSPGAATFTPSPTPTHTSAPVESSPVASPIESSSPLEVLSPANITLYLESIFNSTSDVLPRLACPSLDESKQRYDGLKKAAEPKRTVAYYFAIDLRETLPLLPRLLGSVVEVMRFLGPARCALSIVEGNSADGTRDVLAALREQLTEELPGVRFYLQAGAAADPAAGDRIARLAALRNRALQPLREDAAVYTADTTIVFLNDVAACPEDMLELVHQRQALGADMTCGLDWVFSCPTCNPTFYDVWVARGLTGDAFFDIPADGSWDSAWNLFWNDPTAQLAFAEHRPFQVFSCWNGGAVFKAGPVLDGIEFRSPHSGECPQGEPQLFCKDLWAAGHGRIAVVPYVHLEYSDANAARIKNAKGYTSRWTAAGGGVDGTIAWQAAPPEKVRCMPSYDQQSFRPWNEGLMNEVDDVNRARTES